MLFFSEHAQIVLLSEVSEEIANFFYVVLFYYFIVITFIYNSISSVSIHSLYLNKDY